MSLQTSQASTLNTLSAAPTLRSRPLLTPQVPQQELKQAMPAHASTAAAGVERAAVAYLGVLDADV